jgi:hypothetical protein
MDLFLKPNSYAIYKQLQEAKLNILKMTIWRVLHDQLWYPYCAQQVQGLKTSDSPPLQTLCRCSFQLRQIFGRNGIINFHNHQQWVEDKPHGELQSRHHRQFSINVSAGTVGNCLAGPCVLSCQLTVNHYQVLFSNGLSYLLEDVPVSVRESMFHISAMICEMSSTVASIACG